jgi:hypothetical protein
MGHGERLHPAADEAFLFIGEAIEE